MRDLSARLLYREVRHDGMIIRVIGGDTPLLVVVTKP